MMTISHTCKTIAAALAAAVFITACSALTPGDSAATAVSYEPLSGNNPCPAVIPSIREWEGGDGEITLDAENTAWINSGTLSDSSDGQIRYDLVSDESLGEEGYRIDLGCASAPDENGIHVYAYTETGLYWGNITLQQMIVLAGGDRDDTAGDVALVRGRILDYPVGKVRGLMIDVGRNTMSLQQVQSIARNLSWYKMNELTLHLQDNALLTYSDKTDHVDTAYEAYSAFRMESEITNDDGESITASDMRYSAKEFADLVEFCKGLHVSLIPEIDTPAHSLALTSVFRDRGLNGRPDSVDMLDCSNPDALSLVCDLWDEQLETAFADVTTIQIGGDEYYGQAVDFINYEQGLLEHLASSGKTIRMWGSLTALKGDHELSANLADYSADGTATGTIQMQLWSTYWADPQEMYDMGFDLINSSSNRLYINCGEATDYLDKEDIYNNYTRTEYTMTDGSIVTLPETDQLIGSSAALWNDLIDNLEIGINEYDMTDRILDALPVLGEVFWNEDGERSYEEFAADAETIGTEPTSDPLHQADALTVGPPYEITMEVYLPSDAGEDADYVITNAEVDDNYYEFTARNENGRVGFTCQFNTYEFDYELPTDQWVTLKVVGRKDVTELYADGELVSSVGSSAAYELHATFLFPTILNENYCGSAHYTD